MTRQSRLLALFLGGLLSIFSGCGLSEDEQAAKNMGQGRYFLQRYFESLGRLSEAQSTSVAQNELEEGWVLLAASNTAFGLDKSILGTDAVDVSVRMLNWIEDMQQTHFQISKAYKSALQVDQAIATPEFLLSSFVRGAAGDPFGATQDALAAQQMAVQQWQVAWYRHTSTIEGGIPIWSAIDRWIHSHPEYDDIIAEAHDAD